ncbi:MAG: hypothetical protein SFZ03_03355 [Candidatus Melainabacteria bacterium]|nr:hypothetical protein [Candidatus Melainabacteria bacterium]
MSEPVTPAEASTWLPYGVPGLPNMDRGISVFQQEGDPSVFQVRDPDWTEPLTLKGVESVGFQDGFLQLSQQPEGLLVDPLGTRSNGSTGMTFIEPGAVRTLISPSGDSRMQIISPPSPIFQGIQFGL